MDSRCSNRASTAAADLAPQPGMPGIAVGGVAHQRQPVGDGARPDAELGDHALLVQDDVAAAVPARRRARRETACARSLSGEQITTCSTPGCVLKRAAAVASASSASNSTMGQTTMPSAATARSASGNWASRSASTPAPVLYPGYRSLRKDSMTWSKAQATCVTPGVETSSEEAPQEADGGADLAAVRAPCAAARRSGCGTARRCRRPGGSSCRSHFHARCTLQPWPSAISRDAAAEVVSSVKKPRSGLPGMYSSTR